MARGGYPLLPSACLEYSAAKLPTKGIRLHFNVQFAQITCYLFNGRLQNQILKFEVEFNLQWVPALKITSVLRVSISQTQNLQIFI